MVNNHAQAQREAPLKTEQSVRENQSVEITQILLHGCLSYILYLRNIFPDECFFTQYFPNNSSDWSYREYASGANDSATHTMLDRNVTGGPISTLKRGRSTRVDGLLHLMETGIFDALRQGYLKSMCITVHESAQLPESVMEAWTFTFHYGTVASKEGQTSSVNSIDVTNTQGSIITVQRARLAVNDFVKKLITLLRHMPPLPDEKHFKLQLIYTDDSPDEYRAPGFDQPVVDLLNWPETGEAWKKATMDVGLMTAGHHATSLRVSYLDRTDAGVREHIPSGLLYTSKAPISDDVAHDLSSQAQNLWKAVPISPVRLLAMDNTTLPKLPSSSTLLSSDTDRLDSERLQNMLLPPPPSTNTEATQPRSSDMYDLPVEDGLMSPSTELVKKIQFLAEKVDELALNRSVLSEGGGITELRSAGEHQDTITVNCDCENATEEGDMISCSFCGTFQHLHCYGYLDTSDPRLPHIHVCYACLLEREAEARSRIRLRITERRALWLLRYNTYDNTRVLSTALGSTLREVDEMVKQFRAQGLLAPSLGPSKKAKQRLVLTDYESAKGKMQRTFFDPSYGIEHHIEQQNNENTQLMTDTRKRTRDLVRDDEAEGQVSKRRIKGGSSQFVDGDKKFTPQAVRVGSDNNSLDQSTPVKPRRKTRAKKLMSL